MTFRSEYLTILTLTGLVVGALLMPRQPAGRPRAAETAAAGVDYAPVGTTHGIERAKAPRRKP